MDLRNKVALITGATSGIGEGVARDLAGQGVRLALTGRRKDRLEALSGGLETESFCLPGDICEPGMAERLVAETVDHFGGLDIVLNGAGSMHAGPVEKLDLEAVRQMCRANYESALMLSYAVLKYFKEQDSGTLINISSILGTKVRPGTGAYAGTKFGIEALSEALRMEMAGTGVRVSVIEPGVVETELQNHFEKHPREVLGIEHPLLPEDIARAVRFILTQPPHVRIPVMMVLPGEQAM